MTDWLLGLVPTYGPILLMIVSFLGCFALPVPASMMLLAAGGFVAAGDLSLWMTALATFAGVAVGDQAVYFAGRRGGEGLIARLGRRAAPIERAKDMLLRRGAVAVFLSRWLVSPLGPYVNLAAGVAGVRWAVFTISGMLGIAVWVGLYLGLGYGFAGNLEAASQAAVKYLGFIAAGAAAVGLGLWLRARLAADRRAEAA